MQRQSRDELSSNWSCHLVVSGMAISVGIEAKLPATIGDRWAVDWKVDEWKLGMTMTT